MADETCFAGVVKDGEHGQTDAFDLGADDDLTKPFSFLILMPGRGRWSDAEGRSVRC